MPIAVLHHLPQFCCCPASIRDEPPRCCSFLDARPTTAKKLQLLNSYSLSSESSSLPRSSSICTSAEGKTASREHARFGLKSELGFKCVKLALHCAGTYAFHGGLTPGAQGSHTLGAARCCIKYCQDAWARQTTRYDRIVPPHLATNHVMPVVTIGASLMRFGHSYTQKACMAACCSPKHCQKQPTFHPSATSSTRT